MTSELRQPNTWLYYGLILLAAGLLGVTTWQSIQTSAELRRSIERVSHSNEVLRTLNQVSAALGDMEAYGRAFVLTEGSTWAMEATSAAIGRLEQGSGALVGLVRDNADQRALAEEIAEVSRQRIASAVNGMQSFSHGEFTVATVGARVIEANAVSQRIRDAVAKMDESEQTLRRSRWRAMDRRLEETRSMTVIANSLALAAGLLGLFLMHRSQYAWRRQQLAEMEARRARAASAEKSAFLASMSHEIRTPMNAIFGFSQLLAGAVKGAREQQYVHSIQTSGKALLALINDLLDLSKIEAGRLQLAPGPTDVRELIDDVLAMFSQMADEKRLAMRAEVDASMPAALELDGARLRQILINLIGNAVKYTDAGGVLVRVHAFRSETDEPRRISLHVMVEDTGLGIDSAQAERIFQPFVQGEAGGSTRDGAGLGLSIVRRLVDLMGGEVALESQPGRGSVFRVKLPNLPIMEAAPDTAEPERVEFDRLKPARILVVDDVAWNRDLMLAYFRGTRHRVFTAADGEEAVATARRERPDVVLMDIRMPRLDGRAARDRIRADPSLAGVKVVAVTASSLSGEESELRRQFDGYVRKPFSQQELFDILSRLLSLDETPAPESPVPQVPVSGPPADETARERARTRLQVLHDETWPRLREALPMRECAAFGAQLIELGEILGHQAMMQHGQRLRRAAERFDLGALEGLMRTFPGIANEVVAPEARS